MAKRVRMSFFLYSYMSMMFDTNVSSTNKWNVCCESRPYTGWNTEIDVFQCYVLE